MEKANNAEILKIINEVIEKNTGPDLFNDEKFKLTLKFYLGESEGMIAQYNDAVHQATDIINKVDKEYK